MNTVRQKKLTQSVYFFLAVLISYQVSFSSFGSDVATNSDELVELADTYDDPTAQYLLGKKYLTGDFKIKQSFRDAAKWFAKAADSNHKKAKYQLGKLYFFGKGVPQDYANAARLLIDSDPEFNDDALYLIATLYEEGRGVKKNPERAYKYYRLAAEEYHIQAQYRLGVLYYNGIGVKRNLDDAKKWLALSVEGGNNDARSLLNIIEKDLSMVELSHPKMPHQEEKSQESPQSRMHRQAENGDAISQYKLGLEHLKNSELHSNNNEEAVKWLTRAANQNHHKAQLKLGELYFNGTDGTNKDLKKAKIWLTKAAGSGVNDAKKLLAEMLEKSYILDLKKSSTTGNPAAQHTLAQAYVNGQFGLNKDISKAISLYEKAANQNYAHSQYALAKLYQDDIKLPRNLEKSKQWLILAAKNDFKDAAQILEEINSYDAMNHEPPDDLVKSAKSGDLNSQVALADKYLNGNNVPLNLELAANWYMLAAKQGNAESQYQLGLMYSEGKGVKRSRVHATKWFTQAANNGHDKARILMRECRMC